MLYDGRTGEKFDQRVTVGYIYMLKLHHLVDDKIHARATGPYSLITQQPLGGKAGGSAASGSARWKSGRSKPTAPRTILQELLTVKSDDVEGRTKIYESMVKGENTLEAGTARELRTSLTNEIRGLGLNMQLEREADLICSVVSTATRPRYNGLFSWIGSFSRKSRIREMTKPSTVSRGRNGANRRTIS